MEKAKDNNVINTSSATYKSKGKLNANLLVVAKTLIAGRDGTYARFHSIYHVEKREKHIHNKAIVAIATTK